MRCMDLDFAAELEHAKGVWEGERAEAIAEAFVLQEQGDAGFEDAFWAAVTPTDLPRAQHGASIVAFGLRAALLSKFFDRRVWRQKFAAKARAAVLHDAAALSAALSALLVAAIWRLRNPVDPVRSIAGRVAAVLTPRLGRPNPLSA